MPFDGGSPHRDRPGVASEQPKDLGDLVAEAMAQLAPRRKPKPLSVELPPEAPVLTLWKKVAAHRDLLVRQITSWEEFRHQQRRGQRRSQLKNRWLGVAAEQLRLSRELHAASDTMITGWIEQLRTELGTLDRGLRKLHGAAGKRDLERLAQSLHDALIAEAVSRVESFVTVHEAFGRGSGASLELKTTRFLATMALLHARDGTPRLLNDDDTAERARAADLNLEQLVEDQRVARKLSQTSRPRSVWIVAMVLGISPNARAFRR